MLSLSISTYTFLAIVIHHHITIPAITFIELFFVLWITYLFITNNFNIRLKLQILITILFINLTFFSSYSKNLRTETININFSELTKFKNKNYLCPADLYNFKKYKNIVISDLLSGLLNKRYYSDLAYDTRYNSYNYYHLAVPMAIPAGNAFYNPCKK